MTVNQCRSFLIFTLLFTMGADIAGAQNLDDAFLKEHLEKKIYSLDSEADAVVLYEKTMIRTESNIRLGFEQITHVYKCIKILKTAAIDMRVADISTGYVYGRSSYVNNIIGTTYNMDDGKIEKTPLLSSAAFKKNSGEFYEMVFTMPEVKVGSIVEYSYDINAPLSYYPMPWVIQGPFPKLQSEYEIESPSKFNYIDVSQLSVGDEPFRDYNTKKETQADNVTSYHVLTEMNDKRFSVLWGKRNIPSVNEEPFICNIINHRDRLDLQISAVYNGNFLYNQEILTTWKKLNDLLWSAPKFGEQLKTSNNFLNRLVDSLSLSDTSAMGKARSIYNYVRKNIDYDHYQGLYATEDIYKVLNNKRGSVADINLLLTAMFSKAGINASPVVLSTLGNLRINPSYPLLNRFNYVVSMVTIDSVRYFFDASDKFNPFGILPTYCYNGYARIIDSHGDELFLSPDDLKERNVYVVNIDGIGDSLCKINIAEKHGMFSSMSLRKKWDGDSTALHKYIKGEAESYKGDVTISDMKTINLENADTNLIIKYTLNITSKQAGIIYLNADFRKFYSENPFKSTHRKLPVEFPNKFEDIYVMTLKLPENMEAEDLPKPIIVKYDEGNIMFKHLVNYDSSNRVITVNSNFTVAKTNFDVKEYSTIREFFGTMVENENDMLVLKKVKDK